MILTVLLDVDIHGSWLVSDLPYLQRFSALQGDSPESLPSWTLRLCPSFVMDFNPPHKGDLPQHLKQFWGSWHYLNVDGDFIVCICRLFIPTAFHSTVLGHLHKAWVWHALRIGLSFLFIVPGWTKPLRCIWQTASSVQILFHLLDIPAISVHRNVNMNKNTSMTWILEYPSYSSLSRWSVGATTS